MNSILTAPGTQALKRAYGAQTYRQYEMVIETLITQILDYERFGVLEIGTSVILDRVGLSSIYRIEVVGDLGEFLTVAVKPKFLKVIDLGMNILLDDPDFVLPRLISQVEDPFLRPWDELGEQAEAEPRLGDLPEHVHWGNECFLLTEERLKAEINAGNYARLLHRTPYRPLPVTLSPDETLPA